VAQVVEHLPCKCIQTPVLKKKKKKKKILNEKLKKSDKKIKN
jgi:hypothetical protein